ncbi:MAG: pilus assembly protein PilM [Dysgonamonadaceae bacterium]|jgi:cell division protein FtsA|nr:pilus assembly protein PilM [Dysgonamonadaceae bacterium]
MVQGKYVAALDLGTSKIIAIAATKSKDGVITISKTEKIASGTCIRRGFIYNIEETSMKISSLVKNLTRQLRPLQKIYVGIGGQSLRTEYYTAKKEINGEAVDNEIIDSLYEECRKYQPEMAEVLDIVSPEYFLDGRPETNPIGVPCQVIEAKFQLILGRPSLKLCLKKSIEEKSKIEIAGFFISPLATAAVVLSDREKELGCALVEFGAGITYLSVYKGNLLKYMIAIPLGGNVITKDLCSLNILEPDAEQLKISKGNALNESEKEEPADIIIESRVNEIIANIMKQIEISGYGNELPEGIIITGGGALLKNMTLAIKKKTNMPVKLATAKESLVSEKSIDRILIEDPANVTIFGLLYLANDNCAKVIPRETSFESRTTSYPSKYPQTPGQGGEKGQESQISLFDEEEIDIVEKPTETTGRRLETPQKKKVGFFDRFKKGLEGASKSLFDDDNIE